MRFDVPVVGLPTVESMKLGPVPTALGDLTQNRTLLFDREKTDLPWPTMPGIAIQGLSVRTKRRETHGVIRGE